MYVVVEEFEEGADVGCGGDGHEGLLGALLGRVGHPLKVQAEHVHQSRVHLSKEK